MLDVGADMSDDLPPSYTAAVGLDETKINHQLTLAEHQLPGAVSYYPQHGQPLPPQLIHAYPSAPPGYATAVVYYPAAPNFADATVRLQPAQPQPQPQVITIHQQPAPESDDAELSNTRSTDICLLCCMCLCCCCPCVLVSFM